MKRSLVIFEDTKKSTYLKIGKVKKKFKHLSLFSYILGYPNSWWGKFSHCGLGNKLEAIIELKDDYFETLFINKSSQWLSMLATITERETTTLYVLRKYTPLPLDYFCQNLKAESDTDFLF